MRKPLLWGLAAGAVGTIALDVVTYLDMVARARPASSLPTEVPGALAERAGVELAAEVTRASGRPTDAAASAPCSSTAWVSGSAPPTGCCSRLYPRRAGHGRRPSASAWRR
jgi:hypothetical protein